ncbi:MAG: HesA/MoeB/ThiF family protein, partial [Methylophilaceae bacterium]
TRYMLNRLCFRFNKPLVSGAAISFEGQISVFDFRKPNTPCYACLFPDDGSENSMRCADNGVFSPLVGIIGATQAAEAIKVLLGIGETLAGRLMLLDALNMEWRSIKFSKDYGCKVCNRPYNK